MQRIQRNAFLKGALVTSATMLNFLYPDIIHAATRSRGSLAGPTGSAVQALDGPDPAFAGGQVTTITPDGIVLAAGPVQRAVRLPAGTAVWKEFDMTAAAIQLGDWVDVKGVPLTDGSLLAQSGWVFVNIGRREGMVTGIAADSVTVTDARGGIHTMDFSARLEVVDALDASPLPAPQGSLATGMRIGAVGLRLPDGRLRATRIWRYPAA